MTGIRALGQQKGFAKPTAAPNNPLELLTLQLTELISGPEAASTAEEDTAA